MPLVCTDPRFPVEIKLGVLADSNFVFDEEFWSFSGGWVWNSNGRVVGTSVTNGVHFLQTSGKFLLNYGAGDNDIIDGEPFEYSFQIVNQPDNNFGRLRIVWGANVTSFVRGNQIHSGIINAPGAGNIQLAAKSGANTFFGEIKNFSISKRECRAGTNAEDSGDGGFGGGDGGVGGIIIKGGEEPKTIYAKNFYLDEFRERFGETMALADELDNKYATTFGSQE